MTALRLPRWLVMDEFTPTMEDLDRALGVLAAAPGGGWAAETGWMVSRAEAALLRAPDDPAAAVREALALISVHRSRLGIVPPVN